MKARMNIRSIIMIMAAICLASMFFINISFATNTGKISTETARLREQPQTDSKILELVSLGEEVEILEEADGWYKVKYNNITGYIRTDLIEVENNETNNNTETENTETSNVTTENEITETNTTPVEETQTVEKGKYKILENVKLKIIPLISAIELDEVNKDTEVEVIEVLNDWAKIRTDEGKEGWVVRRRTATTGEIIVLFGLLENTDNTTQNETTINNNTSNNSETTSNNQIENTTKTMYVNSQTINVREEATTSSQVIKQLTINTQVTVISSDNGWAYVEIEGTKGYIAENLLSDTKQETSRSSMTQRSTTNTTTTQTNENTTQTTTASDTATSTNTTTSNTSTAETTSSTGSAVVAYAKQFLGYKYVYGGTTTSGFDCSGFTQFVYKHFGVTLNRTAAAQYSNGTAVTNLQAGDLVMFGKSGINHVGIYIGGNTFIHAANASRGVTTDTLASGYYKTNYVGARRIF